MLIIRCLKCNTPQYIKEGQQTRICPRCGIRIQCKKMKVYYKTNTIREANLLVRYLKTPKEVRKNLKIDIISSEGLNLE